MIGKGIRVCVVEDDDDLREELACALSRDGFDVRAFSGSLDLYAALLHQPADLLLLDLGLPGEDGHTIMRRLKDAMPLGIVICSARSAMDERVSTMMTGADAYLVKPVDMRELVATLVSVHRRLSKTIAISSPEPPGWSLIDDGWSLRTPEGATLPLTASEGAVLRLLFTAPGQPVSRDSIVQALGHSSDYYLDHRLDMLLSRLRRKVRELSGLRLPLRAVRGVGFILHP
ncbi:response regulator transcription factor [Alcanivorax sp. JB21]|uniref:response regulator transcription factor n=1 Tax=Alcanivorax limicola TaxID=2874102 RepID=UPI001CBCD4CE|nr:response regulator transcription factor [Alcanivorax limicola]MBZ2188856.1 response regulator transcription factor [Alcanivorax limicola]